MIEQKFVDLIYNRSLEKTENIHNDLLNLPDDFGNTILDCSQIYTLKQYSQDIQDLKLEYDSPILSVKISHSFLLHPSENKLDIDITAISIKPIDKYYIKYNIFDYYGNLTKSDSFETSNNKITIILPNLQRILNGFVYVEVTAIIDDEKYTIPPKYIKIEPHTNGTIESNIVIKLKNITINKDNNNLEIELETFGHIDQVPELKVDYVVINTISGPYIFQIFDINVYENKIILLVNQVSFSIDDILSLTISFKAPIPITKSINLKLTNPYEIITESIESFIFNKDYLILNTTIGSKFISTNITYNTFGKFMLDYDQNNLYMVYKTGLDRNEIIFHVEDTVRSIITLPKTLQNNSNFYTLTIWGSKLYINLTSDNTHLIIFNEHKYKSIPLVGLSNNKISAVFSDENYIYVSLNSNQINKVLKLDNLLNITDEFISDNLVIINKEFGIDKLTGDLYKVRLDPRTNKIIPISKTDSYNGYLEDNHSDVLVKVKDPNGYYKFYYHLPDKTVIITTQVNFDKIFVLSDVYYLINHNIVYKLKLVKGYVGEVNILGSLSLNIEFK